MIDNLSGDELLDDVKMPIMNWVECPAVKPYSQCELLIEAEYDVQEECKYSESDEAKTVWWHWQMAGSFTEKIHVRRLLLTRKKF